MMLQIIGGKHKKRRLRIPPSSTRPTTAQTRETVFNISQHHIEGARFLDLFAGSGAMGLEALSRGALHATFIEKNRAALATLKANIALLHEEENTTLVAGDVIKLLPQLEGPFDMVYVDPPYGKGFGARVLETIDALPLLTENGLLFIEDTALELPPLKRLALKKRRPVGHALLFEFIVESA